MSRQNRFEKWVHVPKYEGGRASLPIVSIHHRGIRISKNITRQAGMDRGAWNVVLYYDRGRRVVGIEPVAKGAEGSFKTRKYSTGGRQFSCACFFSHYGIKRYGGTRQYPARWDGKMILIDLKKSWRDGHAKKGR